MMSKFQAFWDERRRWAIGSLRFRACVTCKLQGFLWGIRKRVLGMHTRQRCRVVRKPKIFFVSHKVVLGCTFTGCWLAHDPEDLNRHIIFLQEYRKPWCSFTNWTCHACYIPRGKNFNVETSLHSHDRLSEWIFVVPGFCMQVWTRELCVRVESFFLRTMHRNTDESG